MFTLAARRLRLSVVQSVVLVLIALACTCAPPRAEAATRSSDPAADCAKLSRTDLANVSDVPAAIGSADYIPASSDMRGYCRVRGMIAPHIQYDLRLPDDWTGRYLQGGCGGFCGMIMIDQCAPGLARGFAVAASDLGHSGGAWVSPVWATDPQLRRDYGGRATHELAKISKIIIKLYYGEAPKRSYFQGCSTGGREGLQVAQNHPEDFDGIIAGDPAFPGRLSIWNTWIAQQLMDNRGAPVFSRAALGLLHAAVTEACDAKDGLKDGIIADPRRCSYDPQKIQCKPGRDGTDCLTVAQVAAARAMYDGARNSGGELLYPGAASRGSELDWDGPLMAHVSQEALRFLAFPTVRPAFSYRSFNWDRDEADVRATAGTYDAVEPGKAPDLSRFHARGGRLIAYHGFYDVGVPPGGIIDYYAQVWNREGGLAATKNWFRLFMVPGMFHCRGGDAPNTFDMLTQIVDWVEKDRAPNGVIATQSDKSGTVVRRRPLYAYPNVARFSGRGDPNDAANWNESPQMIGEDRVDWAWKPS
jgi:feruloyl esterase